MLKLSKNIFFNVGDKSVTELTIPQKRQFVRLAVRIAFRHHDYFEQVTKLIDGLHDNVINYVYFHVMRDLKTQPADQWIGFLQDAYTNHEEIAKRFDCYE